MLPPDLIKKIKRIHIASAKAVDTAMSRALPLRIPRLGHRVRGSARIHARR